MDPLSLHGDGEEIHDVLVVVHLGRELHGVVGGVGREGDGPDGRLHGPAGGIALVMSQFI